MVGELMKGISTDELSCYLNVLKLVTKKSRFWIMWRFIETTSVQFYEYVIYVSDYNTVTIITITILTGSRDTHQIGA